MLLASILIGLNATQPSFVAPPAAPQPPPAPTAAADITPQDPAKDFRDKWAEAMRFEDEKGLASTLGRYKEVAILEFVSRAETRAVNDSPEMDAWVDKFVEVWGGLYSNDFARNYDRYLQLLPSAARKDRTTLIREDFRQVNGVHIKALVEKDKTVDWNILRKSADAFADAMTNTGDGYYTAIARNIQGNVWNPNFRADGADGAKSLKAYEDCIAARDLLGLTNDQFYVNAKNVKRDLRVALGLGPEKGEEPVEEGPRKPRTGEFTPVAEVPPSTAMLEAGRVSKPGAIVHSTDMDGGNRFGWVRFGAGKVGDTTTFPDILPPIHLNRLADNKWQLEAGADPSDDFRLASKPIAITVDRKHDDGTIRPYTLLLAAGSTSDNFQGVSLNLQPSEGGGPVFFRSISTVSADTPFGLFTIYDMDADGSFGYDTEEDELPLRWSEGLLPDTFFFRPDAMTLGKMKHSRPFGPWIQDDKGQWYTVTVDSPGDLPGSVTIQPATVETGTLNLSFSGIKKLKPASILLKSDNSASKGLLLDLATMKGKSFQIPVGRWVFLQARFTGKSGQEFTVLPPIGSALQVDVTAEEAVTMDLGAPFTLTAALGNDGKEITVDGRRLHILGRNGERYLRVMGAPMFGVTASIKGAKTVDLIAPTSEEANDDWERLYYPMDAILELKKAVDNPMVELLLKKHPWFGKLTGQVQG